MLAFLLTGCLEGPVAAPSTATLLVPDSVAISFDSDWNDTQDGLGVVIFSDFMVWDSERGEPLQAIQVEIQSDYGGVYVLPEEAIMRVDPPSAPDDWQENYDEYCYDDEGNFDPSENEWCVWYYDALNGTYYQLSSEYADAGGYGPNYAVVATDERGLARVYIYVDKMPGGADEGWGDVTIWGSIGVASDSFTISSQ